MISSSSSSLVPLNLPSKVLSIAKLKFNWKSFVGSISSSESKYNFSWRLSIFFNIKDLNELGEKLISQS